MYLNIVTIYYIIIQYVCMHEYVYVVFPLPLACTKLLVCFHVLTTRQSVLSAVVCRPLAR